MTDGGTAVNEFDAYNELAIGRLMYRAPIVADGDPSPEEVASEVPDTGQRFRIPLVIPEGVSSGDGRTFAQGALSSRPMPLALMWQPSGEEGHKGAVIVGRIDHVEKTDEGLGNAYGVFDTGEHGQEALRLVKAGMLRGISADLDEFEAQLMPSDSAGTVKAQQMLIKSGRLMGVTLVAKPAFAECTIELVGGDDMADGEYTADSTEAQVAALIASAAPLAPPKAWFENPNLDRATPLTVTDEGRVFGHIASWDVDHIGLPYGTRAPRSASDYAYFRTGVLRTAEGEDVTVGQLTLSGGHAPLDFSAQAAVRHYDDTKSAVADLAAGEDRYGIWVSGALRPEVTPEQVRAMRAAAPSGDWRPIRGKLELVAVCQVNVPGFPIARARVASGMVQALVAAGAAPLVEMKIAQDNSLGARLEMLEMAERRRMQEEAERIRQRMAPVLQERQFALTAAAAQAKARIDARRLELSAQRDAVLQRMAELRAAEPEPVVAAGGVAVAENVGAGFDPGKHPHGFHGRWAQVLATLKDGISAGNGSGGGGAHQEDVNKAINKLDSAISAEHQGEFHDAHGHGMAALGHLADAIKHPDNHQHLDTLQGAHHALKSIVHSTSEARRRNKATQFGQLPHGVKRVLRNSVPLLPQDHALSKFVTPGGSSGFSNGPSVNATQLLSPAQLSQAVAQALAKSSTKTSKGIGEGLGAANKA